MAQTGHDIITIHMNKYQEVIIWTVLLTRFDLILRPFNLTKLSTNHKGLHLDYSS